MAQKKDIVVVGGGIIGCTCAYYLSRHPSYSPETMSIIVLEASVNGVAQGASGKAGGLIAKWAYPEELVRISFSEHVKLAEEHDGANRWGFRFVHCGSWEGVGDDLIQGSSFHSVTEKEARRLHLETERAVQSGKTNQRHPESLNWIKPDLTTSYAPIDPLSGLEGTAQVHPYLFTKSMMQLAAERGANLQRGCATSIEVVSGIVSGVRFTDSADLSQLLPATHVILAAGAWSPSLLPSLPISATRAHSITICPQPGVDIAPYVLFTEIRLPDGRRASPEVYARPDNEIYACGPGDNSRLPNNVDQVEVDLTACETIREFIMSISPEARAGTVERLQACFLPSISRGGIEGPIVGEATRLASGLYIATGHTCWVSWSVFKKIAAVP